MESGQAAATRAAVRSPWQMRWSEWMEPLVRGPQQLESLDQIEADHDNLRAALEWSLMQTEHGTTSLRLAAALPVFLGNPGKLPRQVVSPLHGGRHLGLGSNVSRLHCGVAAAAAGAREGQ